MGPTTLARLAELHQELARVYAEMAAEPASLPVEDRAVGLEQAAAMLGMRRAYLGRRANWERGGVEQAVRRFVREHWATIVRVADALVEHHALTAEQVQGAVEDRAPRLLRGTT